MAKLGPKPFLSRIKPGHVYIDSSGWVRETLGYIHYASNSDVFAVGKLFSKLCKQLEPLRATYTDLRIVEREGDLVVHGYRDATAEERKVIAERFETGRQKNIARAKEALSELSLEDRIAVQDEVNGQTSITDPEVKNLEGKM